jgi:hypothetical protein
MGNVDQTSRRLERRWSTRFAFRADLEIEWGSAVLPASTRDISANGMFIECADTLWVGAGFTARMKLDHQMKLDCYVKRIEPGQGMGVTVVMVETENHQRYQKLLSTLSASGS